MRRLKAIKAQRDFADRKLPFVRLVNELWGEESDAVKGALICWLAYIEVFVDIYYSEVSTKEPGWLVQDVLAFAERANKREQDLSLGEWIANLPVEKADLWREYFSQLRDEYAVSENLRYMLYLIVKQYYRFWNLIGGYSYASPTILGELPLFEKVEAEPSQT